MRDSEILKQAIEKVQKSGLMPANACTYDEVHVSDSGVHLHCAIHKDWQVVESVDDIIFDETFAKAFWGAAADKHLLKLQTYDHPLNYIEKFL